MLFPDHTSLLIATEYPATALCNVSFQCLTSGFMQLTATGCRRNILHCPCLFERKCYLCFRMGIAILKIIILGGISWDMRSEVTFLATLTCHRKTKFSFLLDFFCFGIQFYLLLSHYLRFISLLYLDLYVLEMMH